MISKKIKFVFAMCVVICFYYVYEKQKDAEFIIFKHSGNTVPCVLPEVDPFDPKMMEFVWNPDPIVCDAPAIVYVDSNNTLQFNTTALSLINENQISVHCEISLAKRIIDDDEIEFSKPFSWRPTQPIPGNFFRATCTGSGGTLFDGMLARVHKKSKTFQELDKALAEDKYNVLLFGIDSVSRSSAIRQLPKTFNYLTKSLNGYDFKGYMKVADNTFVNMVPLLTGRFAYTKEVPVTDYVNNWMDEMPLIWKNFSQQNCTTLLAEDYPNLNMFNMEKKGFLHPPTDHYMRPFWKAKKKLTLMYNLREDISRLLAYKSIKLTKTSGLCMVDRPRHVVVMDYIKQFMLTYKDNRKFALFFLTELSHEYQNLLQLGDIDFMNFIKWLYEEGFLENTILVVFSDHGLRFGNVQHLFVARIESRMPFLSIVLPETLKNKYPDVHKSMTSNQLRLATPFDVHATLRDVLDGNFRHPGSFRVNNKLRGISLFQNLPNNRSCAHASISEEYCACHKSTRLNITNNPLAKRIANAVVDHINSNLLKGKAMCAKLKLLKIVEMSKTEQGLIHTGTYRKKHFLYSSRNTVPEVREDIRHTIVLDAFPGNGRFFATCDVFSNSTIRVFGNVDRVNKYGNQSYCMHEHNLKHLCFCP